jgi:hypothetical protein
MKVRILGHIQGCLPPGKVGSLRLIVEYPSTALDDAAVVFKLLTSNVPSGTCVHVEGLLKHYREHFCHGDGAFSTVDGIIADYKGKQST